MENQFEVILCIVNTGFSDVAMEAAKNCGARGGTVINARGTASKDAEKFFNITIQPEKELVMILVSSSIKESILKALYNTVGSATEAQGIAFSLPVDEVAGLWSITKEKDEEKKEIEEK